MKHSKYVPVRPFFVEVPLGFDPCRDLQEVDQFGFVNIGEAFEKGIVPGGVDIHEESFNGVNNPGTLISRSMDVFDGLRKREYVASMLEKLNAEERLKAETALKRAAGVEGVSVEPSPEG